jgi:hypothetical protein
MRIVSRVLLGSWRSTLHVLEIGFEAMARYPYYLSELHWSSNLTQPPQDDGVADGGGLRRPDQPSYCRSIKLVPPPASQRYQAARPIHLPARTTGRNQSVSAPD